MEGPAAWPMALAWEDARHVMRSEGRDGPKEASFAAGGFEQRHGIESCGGRPRKREVFVEDADPAQTGRGANLVARVCAAQTGSSNNKLSLVDITYQVG